MSLILYPIFIECCAYTSDLFWESVFEDLAYGKPPFGTYITKTLRPHTSPSESNGSDLHHSHPQPSTHAGLLCCNYKKKEFSYCIDETRDAKTVHDEVYALLTEKLGLLSKKQHLAKRNQMHAIEQSMQDTMHSWFAMKKCAQELAIELYIVRLRKKHHLTLDQSRNLLSSIFTAMLFKTVTSKDIVFDDGAIQTIHGLIEDSSGVYLEPSRVPMTSSHIESHDAEPLHGESRKLKDTLSSSLDDAGHIDTIPEHIRRNKPKAKHSTTI